MDFISKDLELTAKYMGILNREKLARWLLNDDMGHYDFPEDLDRMQGILHEAELFLDFHDIQRIWKEYSKSVDLDWVEMPKYDDTLLTTLQIQGDIHGWIK